MSHAGAPRSRIWPGAGNPSRRLPPGVVSCPLCHPPASRIGEVAEIDEFCGVGRKP
ncbi:hypothetical protein [Spirillospora sp. NPDC029432]|uniref:hypothetical protein n=1 Tax=Spirillospora sp. NPDC029432 TaxID=3154599 RepID=UPI003454805B